MTATQVEKKRPEVMDSGSIRQIVEPPTAALLAIQSARKMSEVMLSPQTRTHFAGLLNIDGKNLPKLAGPMAQLSLASKGFGLMLKGI